MSDLTPNKFALIIENMVKEKKMSYIDAILDYCKKTTDNNNIKKIRLLKNKETREKKILFKKITENAYTIIQKFLPIP